MGYAFHPDDVTLQASLRRIATDELGHAIARFSQIDQPEAVHAIRKHLKKTRAVLRLLRSGLAAHREENAALRDVGLALAARRDAAVRLTCFDALFPDPPSTLMPLRDQLAAASQPSGSGLPPDLLHALRATRKRARQWSLRGKDNAILRTGLLDTRRRAIRAAKAVRAEPASAPLFHDWRKCVQQHWFEARLFLPCWPDHFTPIVNSTDQLAAALGDHRDLWLFADHVASLPAAVLPDPARGILAQSILAKRVRIEAAVFPLAARIFAGDPKAMAEVWVEWRTVWRDGV